MIATKCYLLNKGCQINSHQKATILTMGDGAFLYIKSSEFPRNSEENSRKKIRAFRENLGILRTRKMCKNPRKARTFAGPRIPRKLGKLGQISSHEKLGQFSEDS